MKLLLSILVFSATAFAGVETKTFTFDGSQPSVEMSFKGEKTHTESRVEQVQTTCYRQEVVGWRTICHGGYRPRPFPGPGPYPYPYPGPGSCYRQPIYRNVSYPCVQSRTVHFEVKDFDVDAKVAINVKFLGDTGAKETFKVTLRGDELSMEVAGSKKFFVVQTAKDLKATMTGSVKLIDAAFAVELVEAAPVLKALKMTNIELKSGSLNFSMGPVRNANDFVFNLNVVKKKVLASDTELFNRDLLAGEMSLETRDTMAIGSVVVKALGIDLTSGKYGLTAKASYRPAGSLLNSMDFGDALTASRTLIYSIR